MELYIPARTAIILKETKEELKPVKKTARKRTTKKAAEAVEAPAETPKAE